MSDRMRALRLHGKGGVDAIVVDDDVAIPQPGIGDVLVRVEAASLTPTELSWPSTWVDHAGADRTPVIPCHEVCGEVVALGYGTTGFAVGDSVYGITDWYRDGAAAEFVAVEARNLAPKPATGTAVDAAALALTGLTAMQALFDLGELRARSRKPNSVRSILFSTCSAARSATGYFRLRPARAASRSWSRTPASTSSS